MDDFPDEVVLKICGYLDFKDLASLRCVTRRLAQVGAEILVKRVRFHVGHDSLQRLKAIAAHNVLCKSVETVVFEGNLLANVGCVHAFTLHFDSDNLTADRPSSPPYGATEREMRLFDRNLHKYQTEINNKFLRYRDFYDTQQAILKSDSYTSLISDSIKRFPKLKKIALTTVGRCRHVLSERFMDMFAVECSLPLEPDTRQTAEQLKAILFHDSQPLASVRELEVHVLSPKFFTGFIPPPQLSSVFVHLKVIDLNFRLERDDRGLSHTMTAGSRYGKFAKGHLREALQAAGGLQKLTVNFDDFGYYGPCTDLKHVLGDSVWPELHFLDLDCMTTSEGYLIDALRRQPALSKLTIGFFTLEDGLWTTATELMRKALHLKLFVAHGILEDPERMHPMHLIDSDSYAENYVEFSLTNALDMYVTDGVPSDSDLDEYHPLDDDNFSDPDELREEFGPYDSFDDMDCSE
ncbi:hypothetical protein LTR84_012093 [Exophiala bonariae]|uniref:F-box domain-containing protein n=1 Tax=Exophiala bonariae TaxID=1690606 RepID=A0AAV9NF68_9EURO|nr:hypothetical protein LTR84_012093 [Exophiala bonariae]